MYQSQALWLPDLISLGYVVDGGRNNCGYRLDLLPACVPTLDTAPSLAQLTYHPRQN